MTSIVTELRAAGVRLAIEDGKVRATGDRAALARWLSVLRERRDEIAAALKVGAGEAEAEPFEPAITPPSAPLTPDEEKTIRRWLALIGETDPATIATVIGQCLSDAAARAYFLERAAEEPPAANMTNGDSAAAQQNPMQKLVQD